MSQAQLKSQERRTSNRLTTQSLFVVIEDQVNLNFASLDYSSKGMGILTDISIEINKHIEITIGNDEGFLISDVIAIVRNRSYVEKTGEYRLGLEFDYESQMTDETKQKLKMLETILKSESE